MLMKRNPTTSDVAQTQEKAPVVRALGRRGSWQAAAGPFPACAEAAGVWAEQRRGASPSPPPQRRDRPGHPAKDCSTNTSRRNGSSHAGSQARKSLETLSFWSSQAPKTRTRRPVPCPKLHLRGSGWGWLSCGAVTPGKGWSPSPTDPEPGQAGLLLSLSSVWVSFSSFWLRCHLLDSSHWGTKETSLEPWGFLLESIYRASEALQRKYKLPALSPSLQEGEREVHGGAAPAPLPAASSRKGTSASVSHPICSVVGCEPRAAGDHVLAGTSPRSAPRPQIHPVEQRRCPAWCFPSSLSPRMGTGAANAGQALGIRHCGRSRHHGGAGGQGHRTKHPPHLQRR